MAVFLDYTFDNFPDYHYADEDGLLAIGGMLSLPVLKQAYQKGIFPWYNPNEPPLWWCPDPRCVIFTEADYHFQKHAASYPKWSIRIPV
jgi:Leu/Phe-tRNA-protein transferase